jgi:predicted DNA-binding protein
LFFDRYGLLFIVVTETLSIKVSKELKARLRAAAKSRQTKASTLMREALELVISGTARNSKPSLYDLSLDLFENLGRGGPRDLSTNRKHLGDLGK